ncbi:MAG: ExbD/TolR family protein [Nitrospiria bacterium]
MLRLKTTTRKSGSAPSINMTPMVDVVFLLLIFFLLTSMAISSPVLDLHLPKAAHAENDAERAGLQIVIRKGGQVEIDRETVGLVHLERTLETKLAARPETRVLLSAAEKAPFGVFVRVIDTLQGLNHKHLAIVTQEAVP